MKLDEIAAALSKLNSEELAYVLVKVRHPDGRLTLITNEELDRSADVAIEMLKSWKPTESGYVDNGATRN